MAAHQHVNVPARAAIEKRVLDDVRSIIRNVDAEYSNAFNHLTQENEDLKVENARLRAHFDEASGKLKKRDEEATDLQQRLRENETHLNSCKKQRDTAMANSDSMKSRLAELEEQLASAKAVISELNGRQSELAHKIDILIASKDKAEAEHAEKDLEIAKSHCDELRFQKDNFVAALKDAEHENKELKMTIQKMRDEREDYERNTMLKAERVLMSSVANFRKSHHQPPMRSVENVEGSNRIAEYRKGIEGSSYSSANSSLAARLRAASNAFDFALRLLLESDETADEAPYSAEWASQRSDPTNLNIAVSPLLVVQSFRLVYELASGRTKEALSHELMNLFHQPPELVMLYPQHESIHSLNDHLHDVWREMVDFVAKWGMCATFERLPVLRFNAEVGKQVENRFGDGNLCASDAEGMLNMITFSCDPHGQYIKRLLNEKFKRLCNVEEIISTRFPLCLRTRFITMAAISPHPVDWDWSVVETSRMNWNGTQHTVEAAKVRGEFRFARDVGLGVEMLRVDGRGNPAHSLLFIKSTEADGSPHKQLAALLKTLLHNRDWKPLLIDCAEEQRCPATAWIPRIGHFAPLAAREALLAPAKRRRRRAGAARRIARCFTVGKAEIGAFADRSAATFGMQCAFPLYNAYSAVDAGIRVDAAAGNGNLSVDANGLNIESAHRFDRPFLCAHLIRTPTYSWMPLYVAQIHSPPRQ